MKAPLLALFLTLAAAGIAQAGACDDALKQLDNAVAAADLDADVKAEIQDMRTQAAQLCAAGNEDESLDVLSEATAILSGE
jgi:hypothetical protein